MQNTPIKNIEQAKKYFLSMGCSHFHMTRENPQRAKEYRALKISSQIESEWIKEEFEDRLKNFDTIAPSDYGSFLRSLSSMIERKEFYLEKLLELINKIRVNLPLDQIEYVLSTIIGNNGTKSRGGLIQKAYDLNRKDLAGKFYSQAKLLFRRAEENTTQLSIISEYLSDVIEFYGIEEQQEFINKLKNKKDSPKNQQIPKSPVNNKLDEKTKLKFTLLIVILTLMVGFFLFKMIEHHLIERSGIITEATVISKSKMLGGKPLKYTYYLFVNYKDVNGKIYKDKITVDAMKYRIMEKGDKVQIKYSRRNPKKAIYAKKAKI